MKKEIDLEKIILEAYGCKDIAEFNRVTGISITMIKEICFEACDQCIDLCSENASITFAAAEDGDHIYVSKQSILQVKDWIK
jgi:NAD-dependent dihydropyrimidine dehydrogenase PreA subunit